MISSSQKFWTVQKRVLYSRINIYISLKCSRLTWIYYFGQWSVWAAPAGWESNITADLPRTFHTNITESARQQLFSLLIHTQHPKAESPFFTNHLVLCITLHDNCRQIPIFWVWISIQSMVPDGAWWGSCDRKHRRNKLRHLKTAENCDILLNSLYLYHYQWVLPPHTSQRTTVMTSTWFYTGVRQ